MSQRERLTDEAIATFLAAHPGYISQGNALRRTYTFADYSATLAFVVRVSLAAEKRDHHPDITFGWGRAEVAWSTHDRGGVTGLDAEMAKATDRLYAGA